MYEDMVNKLLNIEDHTITTEAVNIVEALKKEKENNVEATKLYVVSIQDENWEDSGGSHDPCIIKLTDAEIQLLECISPVPDCVSEEDIANMCNNPAEEAAARILFGINNKPLTSYEMPVTIHGYFTIWTH